MKNILLNTITGNYNSKLAFIAASLFACYLVLVTSTIMGVSERKNNHREIRDLTIALIEQESHYMQLTNALTFETAQSRGFIDARFSRFVYTHRAEESLALR